MTRRAAVGLSAAVLLMTTTIVAAQVQVKPAAEGKNEKPLPQAPTQVNEPIADAPVVSTTAEPEASDPSKTKPSERKVEKDPFDNGYGDVEVPGRVVDPGGKPVAGATIFLRNWGVRVPARKTTTDAEGRFKFTTFRRRGPKTTVEDPNPVVRKSTFLGITFTITESKNYQGAPSTDEEEIQSIKPWIVATAPGFGFGTLAPGDDVTIRLCPDTPITGRVTDDAGKPLAGARVRVRDVMWIRTADDPIAKQEILRNQSGIPPIPDGDGLDAWLAAIERAANMNDYYVVRPWLVGFIEWADLGDKPAVYAPLIPSVKNDAEGRFSLGGIGRERVAEIYVDGVPNKASVLFVAVNRELPQPILIESHTENMKKILTGADADLLVFGNRVEVALAPGRTIEGVVSDQETGAPLPNVRVIGPTLCRLEYPGYDRFFATTDEKGRYLIDGFPVMKKARFKVDTSDWWARKIGDKSDRRSGRDMGSVPYFGRQVTVNVEVGSGSQEVDFPLSHGVWITGKVVDDATGQGVGHTTIEYHVFNNNPYLKHDLESGIAPELDDNASTNEDGTFRLRAYPGRGIVTGGGGHKYLEGVGAYQIKGLKPEEFHETLYDIGGFSPYLRNTTIEVNIDEDAQSYSCELRLKKGKSRMVTVVDPDGGELNDLEGSGIDNQVENPITKLEYTTFQVNNLYPGENREVVVRSVKRKLMGMATVTDKARGPVTLTLLPWANLKGQLVDDAGQPLSRGLRIALEDGKLPIHTLNGRDYDKQEFLIEPDGSFHIDGLVPGATYQLDVVEDICLYLGNATGEFSLKPGETRDFGPLKIMKPKVER